jgi:quercetin dioxygenase-like cupin family protein
MPTAVPIIRTENEAERRWFFGGGVHTWLVGAQDSGGAFIVFEDVMTRDKMTPLHCHPDADETVYVLEGEIRIRIGDSERVVGRGGVTLAPRGTPHAFVVTSDVARVLTWQSPGTAEHFYRAASEAIGVDGEHGDVDFARVRASAAEHGGTEILGPPPFISA